MSDDLAQRVAGLSTLSVLSPVEQQLLALAAQLLDQLADAPAPADPTARSPSASG